MKSVCKDTRANLHVVSLVHLEKKDGRFNHTQTILSNSPTYPRVATVTELATTPAPSAGHFRRSLNEKKVMHIKTDNVDSLYSMDSSNSEKSHYGYVEAERKNNGLISSKALHLPRSGALVYSYHPYQHPEQQQR